MKVAIIVDRFPQLSETFVLHQIIGLIDDGHHVDIYPISKDSGTSLHSEIEKYQLLSKAFYPPTVPKAPWLASLKFLWLVLKNHEYHPVFNNLRKKAFFKNQSFSARFNMLSIVFPFLRDMTYDIVHCHFGQAGNRAAFIRSLDLLKGKMVTTFYGYDLNLDSIDQYYYTNLVSHCDHYISISNYLAEKASSLDIKKEKIYILPIGVNMDEFVPVEKSAGNKTLRILTVARLVEKKGIYYSIMAFKSIAEKFPDIRYDIVGDGELYENLQELVDKLHLTDRIILHGPRNKTEITGYCRDADIFILPSVTASSGNTEGQGLVLQEAQAMEIPVISTFHNGIPEGVLDGVTGFLVPERNIEALAEKVTFLIEHPGIRKQMGKEGRKYVNEKFDNAILNKKLIQLYQNMITDD